MEKVKQRIIDLIQSGSNGKADFDNIKSTFNKFKNFLSKINENTIKLFIFFTNSDTNKVVAVNGTEMNSFDNYIDLNLPLYLIHFLKFCEEMTITCSNGVNINGYDNLVKENMYQKDRNCNQIILMWKDIGMGRFRILSFVSSNFNEFDFFEKKFFIYEVGGIRHEEVEESWKVFNEITVLDLLEDMKLISFIEGISKMIKD